MLFNVVTGLPRAGSTLLCNLLAQNPAFHASSTSSLAMTIGGVANFWTSCSEIKSDLAHDSKAAEARMLSTLRGMVEGWYTDTGAKVVFDKSRGWMALVDRLGAMYPAAKLLCCIRDPRDVLASIQKQHLKFPILDEHAQTPIAEKASGMLSPQGIIGGPITHIEDQISRRSKTVVPVIFEKLVADPERELRKVYADCKLDWFDQHDFKNVKNVSTDLDALYLNKYPHDGSGEIVKPLDRWQDQIPTALGDQIIKKYPVFSNLFGYV